MSSARRLAAGIAVVAAVLTLAGCVGLVKVTVSQSPLDRVAITVEVCASKETTCPKGATGVMATSGLGQVLLGFRVPAATEDPASFVSSTPEGAVTFKASPSYSAELQRLSPAGSARRWAGYISEPINYASDSGPQSFTAAAGWLLRQAADGGPFVRPFRYRVVVGSRIQSDSKPPSRPVVCADALDKVSDDSTTICVDSPAVATVASDQQFASRDAGILTANSKASAVPGALAAVPFTIKYSGPGGDDAPRLNLSATTDLPGAKATATPNVAIPPADGSVQALVTVEVPAGAKAGNYEVRLTAVPPLLIRPPIIRPPIVAPIAIAHQTSTNVRARAGVGQLTVKAPPSGPGGTLTLSKTTAVVTFTRSRARGFVQVAGRASRAALLNVLLQRLGTASSKGRTPPVTGSVFRTTRVKAGAFKARVAVAPGFLPGRYRVRVAPLTLDDVALPLRTATVQLPAPPKGVVDSAYVSDTKGGSAVLRFIDRAPLTLFATFRFAPGALPAVVEGRGPKAKKAKKANEISIRWFRNDRPLTAPSLRTRKRVLSSFLRRRPLAPLPPGRYKAVLSVGGTLVAVAPARIG